MPRYRKVSTQIWNDAKFRSLSDDGKLLFLFVLTHPHMTSVGAMRASLRGLSEELGWSPQRVSKGFQEAFRKALLRYDEWACCLFLPRFMRHNPPENPNVVKSWAGQLELVPECTLKAAVIQALDECTKGLGEPFRKAFERVSEGLGEPFRKGMPIPEPEPEPEHKPEQENTTRANESAEFAEWYGHYPHKVGRAAAERAFTAARRKTDLDTLVAGVERYRASKPPEREWCNPATWLNQERWKDQPATNGNGRPRRPTPEEAVEIYRRAKAEEAAEDAARAARKGAA